MKLRSTVPFVACAALLSFAYACTEDPLPAEPTPDVDAGATPEAAVPAADASADADAAQPPVSGPVELTFEARVGAEPFACGRTYAGIGTSNATAAAGDLRFFVHDVKLFRGGVEVPVALDVLSPWQSDRLALLDFEDKSGECQDGTSGTNAVVKGTALGTGFDGVTFTVGVPEDLNHLNKDVQPAPLPGSGLNWSWTSGYIHLGVQLNATTLGGEDGGARVPPFYSHVGSSECSGNPADGGVPGCKRKNRPVVRLAGFDPAKHKIVVDAKKLYAASNLDVNTPGTIPGCMSSPNDPECQPVFAALGLDLATGAPTGSPSIFSFEPR